ncbi:MAG: hypothetical protein ACNA8W_26635, partial [Bradymonadaceae bacterium]
MKAALFITILAVTLASATAAAEEPAQILSQDLETSEHPLVGEPLVLRIEVEHARDTMVSIPHEVASTRWEMIDRNEYLESSERAQKTVIELTFAIYRPGPSTLPA